MANTNRYGSLRPLLSRRMVLAGAAGAALASPAHAAAKTLTTGLLVVPDVIFAPYMLAIDQGFFDKEGIAAKTITGGPNSPPMLTLLSAGRVDVAIGNWFGVIDACAKGNDFVVVAANFPQNPSCLMSLPAAPIRTAADILDKKLLLQFKFYSETIDVILKYNKLPVRYTQGPAGMSVDTLLAGDGQGYFAYETKSPIALQLRGLERGKDFIVTPMSEMGYDLPDNLYVVKRETLEKDRASVVSYLRALVRGAALNEKNPALGVDVTVNKFSVDAGFDPKGQAIAAQTFLRLSKSAEGKPFSFTSSQIDRVYELAKISGRETVPSRAALIDLGPLEEALRTA